MNAINAVPEFTTDGTEEVKEPVLPEEVVPEDAELPAAEETEPDVVPQEESTPDPVDPVDPVVQKQVQGLEAERVKLLAEIQQLRGQRREMKKEELLVVDKKIDELSDVNPDDVSLIEKVLKAKGFLTKTEQAKMHYDAVKQEKVDEFLEKFPEYKPENDPHDLNWSALQRELSLYVMPKEAKDVSSLLLRAHRAIDRTQDDTPARRQQVRVASVGAGGGTRTPAHTGSRFDDTKRNVLLNGGWTEEEVQKMEGRG